MLKMMPIKMVTTPANMLVHTRLHVRVIASALLLAGFAGIAHAGGSDAAHQVKRAAHQLLEEQAVRTGWLEPVFNLAVVAPNRPLPTCRQALRIDAVDTRQPRRMRFAATCPGNDGWRHEFIVRSSISAKVLVAAVALTAGHELVAADLVLAQRDVTKAADALADPQAVLGMSSRRSIRAGEVLRESWLVPSILVQRGAAVSIVARSGAIEVSVAGEALDAGARDAVIRVRNTSTGKIIRARVLADATVEPINIIP